MKLKIVSSFMIGILFLFTGCSNTYVEPKSNSNSSLLVLKDRKDGKRIIYTHAKIDNQRLNTYNELITKVRVKSGKHTISLDSTIYYGALAKRAEPVKFPIDFKSQKVYTVELIPHVLKLKNDNDNVKGTYRIFENKQLILKKDLIYSDRILEDTAENSGMNNADLAISVIQAVVLPGI